jgi:hypothetical protein
MEHYVVRREKDKSIWEIALVINPNRFVWVDASHNSLTEEEEFTLAIRMAERILGKEKMKIQKNPGMAPEAQKEVVPPPSQEDLARNFFSLIGEGKVQEALGMMDANENTKQMWGVNFNSVESMKIKSIEPAFKEEWTAERVTYKVMLDVKAKTDQYGWSNGANARWITLTKATTSWVVHELANNP